ncbi:MAG: transglutaminase [Sphingobium sp.]|nr:MAG: transglutaminase [Sphingobium sp.]
MNYLQPTFYFDYTHENIRRLIAAFKTDRLSEAEKAIGLYTKVRDGYLYDPYHISLNPENYRASALAEKSRGNCVEKSIVLIAGLRGLGIPARLRLGKVVNHIAVERLMEKFGSNALTPHGSVDVYLDGNWLKMSPSFNASLCEKLNVAPLEFDGKTDSYLQAYDAEGSRFMEYLEDYGHFEDVPVAFMIKNVKEHYPHIFDTDQNDLEFKL